MIYMGVHRKSLCQEFQLVNYIYVVYGLNKRDAVRVN